MHVIDETAKAVYARRPHTVKRHLSVLPYDVVYTAQVNGAPTRDTATNGIHQLTYDNGSGTLANVVPGMTMAVGSTPGASDIGLLRIRKAPTSSVFYVGETAPGEVPVADGLYLTVYDDFTRWSVKPRLVSKNNATDFDEFHDYDIPYSDQNYHREPIVNIVGRVVDADTLQCVPLQHAGWADSSGYRTVELDAGLSRATGDGLDAGDYTVLWNVNGWEVTEGTLTSAYIRVRMPVGAGWISCTVTDGNGVSKTGRRALWTHDRDSYEPLSQFSVTKDSRRGWREMELDFFGSQDTSRDVIPYSCLVCYWEEHDFGGEPAPDGHISQFYGWVTNDAYDVVKNKPRRRVTIAGMGWWLDHIKGYLTTLSDKAHPSRWWEFSNPTVDLVVHYVLRETTTATALVNLFLSDVATEDGGEALSGTNIWQQITNLASGYMGSVGSDSGGGLWLRKHYSYLEWTDAYLGVEERSSRPRLCELGASDWQQAGYTLSRRHYKPLGWLAADGSWYVDGQPSKQLFSKAPGLTPADGADDGSMPYQRVGGATEQEAQFRLNAMGGHHFARENRAVEDFGLPLLNAMDAAEPCWNPVILLNVRYENGDTVVIVPEEFLIVGVDVRHSNERGRKPKDVTWQIEQVTYGYPGDAYYPPGYNIPPWAYPSFNGYWPGFQVTTMPLNQPLGSLLYDFGSQEGAVAALLDDGSIRRSVNFYALGEAAVYDDLIDAGVANIYAAARDPYSPAYRPPYTSNIVRGTIVYGESIETDGRVTEPKIGTLGDVGGNPTVFNVYTLPDTYEIWQPKVRYHPGVKGLIVVSGRVNHISGRDGDAVYISTDNGLTWTDYTFTDTSIPSAAFRTPWGPGVFLRRLKNNQVEVTAMVAPDSGEQSTMYVRPYVTTDGGATFTPRDEALIPYLSGPGTGYGGDDATLWPVLTDDSNDDLALVIRYQDGYGVLLRSYRASTYEALVDITPLASGEPFIPFPYIGNSVASAAGNREAAMFAGSTANEGEFGVFGTDKLTRMNASHWIRISNFEDFRSVILDRNGGAGYAFGENGSIGFVEPFPNGKLWDRSITDTTARVVELMALPAITQPGWTYAVDFTEEAGEWEATLWNGCTATRTSDGWQPCAGTGDPVRIELAVPGGYDPSLVVSKVYVSFRAISTGLTGTAITIVPESPDADAWIIEHPGTTQIINFEYGGPWTGFNAYVLQGFGIEILFASISGPDGDESPWD